MRRGVVGSVRAVAVALLLAGIAASPAAAADDSGLDLVERHGHQVQALVQVPEDFAVDPAQLEVTVDGRPVDATVGALTSPAPRRTVVLALDSSRSMGDRFAAARAAVHAFLDELPPDVQVGLVAFNSEVEPALAPTTDRARAGEVVDGLTLRSQTKLYDGVLAALDMAGTEGSRRVLVVSDGGDTTERRLAEVANRVEDSGVTLDVLALGEAGTSQVALEPLTTAGQGDFLPTTPDGLTTALRAEADALDREVLVRAALPRHLKSIDVPISVTLHSRTGGDVVVAEQVAPLGNPHRPDDAAPGSDDPVAAPAVQQSGRLIGTTWLYAGAGALALGLLTILLLLALPRRERAASPAERAERYLDRVAAREAVQHEAPSEDALDQVKEAASRMLERNRSLEERISARLEGAGSDLKPAEWLLLHTVLFLVAGAFGLLLGGGNVLVGMLFLVLGVLGPWWFLGFKRSRRRAKFESLLPETLQLMSGALAAGLSLAQSVDTIVREGAEPVAGEYRRALVETRLGISLEDALQGIAERFESRDFEWVVMAIRIQRQVGGNLGELLDTVAETMRERDYMRRQVAALSAEGRMSAYVLGGLPPMFMLYLFFTNRPYVMLFFTEPIGWAMLLGMGLLLSVGIFWMMRMVKVDV